jgi:hypothetical protein
VPAKRSENEAAHRRRMLKSYKALRAAVQQMEESVRGVADPLTLAIYLNNARRQRLHRNIQEAVEKFERQKG